MKHITVEYYHASTPYLSSEAIEKIIQSRGTIKNACREMAYCPKRSEDVFTSTPFHAITSDRKSKKRKPGSSSIRPETSFSANKVGITDILIKKVDEMNDLQARLAQNRKEREEAKHEMKRILDSN
ncbi:hypothetical protein C2G38_2167553 [Gigaspora rosea]|uniref:Uncharacterized protein n=1 Tax=Gigaspora rosea TaxID=44941 RepID=A0A397VTW8_9GLOM|nr:hypothetical protein C2G38_2167553 [Gigaspora rosea]